MGPRVFRTEPYALHVRPPGDRRPAFFWHVRQHREPSALRHDDGGRKCRLETRLVEAGEGGARAGRFKLRDDDGWRLRGGRVCRSVDSFIGTVAVG